MEEDCPSSVSLSDKPDTETERPLDSHSEAQLGVVPRRWNWHCPTHWRKEGTFPGCKILKWRGWQTHSKLPLTRRWQPFGLKPKATSTPRLLLAWSQPSPQPLYHQPLVKNFNQRTEDAVSATLRWQALRPTIGRWWEAPPGYSIKGSAWIMQIREDLLPSCVRASTAHGANPQLLGKAWQSALSLACSKAYKYCQSAAGRWSWHKCLCLSGGTALRASYCAHWHHFLTSS